MRVPYGRPAPASRVNDVVGLSVLLIRDSDKCHMPAGLHSSCDPLQSGLEQYITHGSVDIAAYH